MDFDWDAWGKVEISRNKAYRESLASRLLKAREEARRISETLKSIDPELSSIVLFGSTARGDPASDRFDIDLAVINASRFALLEAAAVAEGFAVNLIQFEYASPRLRENIDREGVVLYG